MGVVDGRNLPLAERVVKGVVDRAAGEPKPHRCVAIDREVGLEAAQLLIGVDVLDDVAPHQRLGELGRPRVKLLGVVGEQRILIGRVALPPASSRSETGEHEEPRARDLRQLGAQSRHHAVAVTLR